ncbi:MAG: hypothetical protein KH436_04640, partial [Firmicutes bacterium]|nr:hypothetical protein [Bacillota bacterium]
GDMMIEYKKGLVLFFLFEKQRGKKGLVLFFLFEKQRGKVVTGIPSVRVPRRKSGNRKLPSCHTEMRF